METQWRLQAHWLSLQGQDLTQPLPSFLAATWSLSPSLLPSNLWPCSNPGHLSTATEHANSRASFSLKPLPNYTLIPVKAGILLLKVCQPIRLPAPRPGQGWLFLPAGGRWTYRRIYSTIKASQPWAA